MSGQTSIDVTLKPDQIPEGWSQIAEVYERAFEPITEQLAAEALRLLKLEKGDRVLDVATGTGTFALAAGRAGGDVLAIDFAAGMIERLHQRIAREAVKNITTAVMDGQALDAEDASFDISASIVGAIFFPDIIKGIAELRRVLKPGGRCAVVCWGKPETFEMMCCLKQAIETVAPDFPFPSETPVWARMSGEQALMQTMKQAGFTRVEVSRKHGVLQLPEPLTFWNDFTASAPPLALLFEKLGEENTRRAGDIFSQLVVDRSSKEAPQLIAEAWVGIGYA
jgi:ubiquinone/menaquinone biosynthesis C-methylase UbiE